MSCISLDLTIEGALADPMVAVVMRADHVDPQRFENLLRSAARTLDDTRGPRPLSFAAMAGRLRGAVTGSKTVW